MLLQVSQLQSLLKPHMLRRMKKDVPDLDIPDKRELVVPVELSRAQKEVYRAILTKNMDVLSKVREILYVERAGCIIPWFLVPFPPPPPERKHANTAVQIFSTRATRRSGRRRTFFQV